MTQYKSIRDNDNQVTILLEINGEVHLLGFEKEQLQALTYLIRQGIRTAMPVKKTQKQLNEFLNYKDGEQQ